jgi:pimeloyl-ACP methyl ester carboxylesterase
MTVSGELGGSTASMGGWTAVGSIGTFPTAVFSSGRAIEPGQASLFGGIRSAALRQTPKVHLTWLDQEFPTQVYIRQGTNPYRNSVVKATATTTGGRFKWTTETNGIIDVSTNGGDTAFVLGHGVGDTVLKASYTDPSGQIATASVAVKVSYPLVLVHGFNSSADAAWTPLASKLESLNMIQGDADCEPIVGSADIDFCAPDFSTLPPPACPVAPFCNGSFTSPIDEGKVLAAVINTLRQRTGADKVTILAHSMGGLAARSYIQVQQGSDVDRLITIGTPHGGTPLADMADDPSVQVVPGALNHILKYMVHAGSPAVRDMHVKGGFIHLLNETLGGGSMPAATKFVSLIGHADPSTSMLLRADFDSVDRTACGVHFVPDGTFSIDPDGKLVPNGSYFPNDPLDSSYPAACRVVWDFRSQVNDLFTSGDGIVSTASQDLGAVLGLGSNSCYATVESVAHANFLVGILPYSYPIETRQVATFLQVLGLEGEPICPRN